MRVTAVVVNHDTSSHLAACLDSLLEQDHPHLRIVVVDNCSRDDPEAVLRQYEGRVEVVRNDHNRGYAGALNDVLSRDDGDALLACNPDVVLASDHVGRLVEALLADPRRGSVQGMLARPDGSVDSTGHEALRSRLFRNRDEGRPASHCDRPAGPVFGVTGALALHRRAMLDDVALDAPGFGRVEWFDEDLFAYFEDIELDWRAATRGWHAWYEPRARATHVRRGMQPGRPALVEELNWRNRLLLLVKFDDVASLARSLPSVLATTLLKTAVLAARHPVALLRAVSGFLRRLPRMLAKRRELRRRASVPPTAVADRWFQPFSYREWWGRYWRRQRP
ncbi:MAG: glycosyltransferase [Nitriliruptorales bacterium]|nr:glycosyltransferase [Nitriliruptorales bacterium]